MRTDDVEKPPLAEPLAELERQLMQAYIAGAGHDLQTLLDREDPAARALRAAASLYASAKLSEVEARLRYLKHLHGEP